MNNRRLMWIAFRTYKRNQRYQRRNRQPRDAGPIGNEIAFPTALAFVISMVLVFVVLSNAISWGLFIFLYIVIWGTVAAVYVSAIKRVKNAASDASREQTVSNLQMKLRLGSRIGRIEQSNATFNGTHPLLQVNGPCLIIFCEVGFILGVEKRYCALHAIGIQEFEQDGRIVKVKMIYQKNPYVLTFDLDNPNYMIELLGEVSTRWENSESGKKLQQNQDSSPPREFELLIGEMFRRYGYKVVETPYQGDHGIDLKVIKPNEYAVVQCKRYKGNVGEPIVRDFFGCMQHEGVDNGYIITTGGFTEHAYKWAKGKKIVLVDGHSLQKMLNETGLN